ncbi:FKBP-type peptidyl-prolyl cis-trans isomerase [Flavimarina sp. Hel_I_48]|uniref:FKBP-type peptidyl-prolyl cis-trans isomerase n=1 Tax=Flavimarina sp. Hel_I_48 TaxID=1392488 RepID=UPI00068E4242|nr:hypothetical protein [Flavimarina sp. Hel_I_48]
MNSKKVILSLVLATMALISCNKDDDNNGPAPVPDRDREEVKAESDSTITAYLETHYYNYEEFDNPSEDFDYKIRFGELKGENADKKSLLEDVTVQEINFADVNYKLYTLVVREGEGKQATYADSVYMNYNGRLFNDERFDGSVTPLWFNLPGVITSNGITGTVPGFANGVNSFKGASSVSLNTDGTLKFSNDYGIGAVFIPAGLAYFSGSQGSIPAYSSLIFTMEIFDVIENTDNDRDGVPNIVEDINKNKILRDDDTDSNGTPNYLDIDDDGDGIPTREEIIINADGSIEYLDTDGDGIPDYLDADS